MTESLSLAGSLSLYERALGVIPGGTQTNSKRPEAYAFGANPIYARRASGSHIWDVDGNEYIDWVMAMGPITLGYCYPAVDAAIREQLERGIIYGLLDPLEVEAAEALVNAVPCAEGVRFLKGGGEATSAAARIARGFTGRERILSEGYHGWQDVWTAMDNDSGVPKSLEGIVRAFPYNDLAALERALEEWRGEVAAVVMCAAQVEEPAPGYLEAVAELTHAHGALLVFDEVVTGFRLALGGAQEYYGVTPELACFAKGIANGMPISAVCGRADVMAAAENLRISVTYGGEALSLAALVACLREYREKDVFAHLWRLGRSLMEGTNNAAAETGCPARARGLAPMSLLRFDGDSEKENSMIWSYFLQEMAKRGVLFRRGGLAFVTYSHSEEDVAHTVAAQREVFAAIEAHRRSGTLEQACQVRVVEPSFRTF